MYKEYYFQREEMTAIEKIETKLKQWPSLRYSKERDTITVNQDTENGFSVWLTENLPGYTVGFDGWHEKLHEEEEALAAFAFGLSDDCRLKVIQRGSTDCAWIVESKDNDGQWRGDSTTGLLLTPFWRKRKIVYRQNNVITSNEQGSAPFS